MYVLKMLFVPFVLFFMLSVLLRYTDSDYPICIFRLFFNSLFKPIYVNKCYTKYSMYILYVLNVYIFTKREDLGPYI